MENTYNATIAKVKEAKDKWQEVVTLCNIDGDQDAAHAASKILCKLTSLEFHLNALSKIGK